MPIRICERGEREIPSTVLKVLYEAYGTDPLWMLTGLSLDVGTTSTDLDILETIIVALETKLKKSRRALSPAKKARLVKLMFLYFRDKPKVDSAHVTEILALTA